MRPLSLAIVLAAAVALGLARGAKGDPERGKQIYVKYGCYQCHGREAQGASTGPRLGPDARPFDEFVRFTRAPDEDMPPYTAKVMTDAELADVYAFVVSRPAPPARPALLAR